MSYNEANPVFPSRMSILSKNCSAETEQNIPEIVTLLSSANTKEQGARTKYQ